MFARVAGVAAAVGFLALALGLPAETFYVGDPGVKLIAARHAAPSSPLGLPLPKIGNDRVAYVEPFFMVHGDHAHAVTSELFPLVTAPLLAMFGIRGAYLLPALGFFLALAATAKLASLVHPRSGALTATIVGVLGTPWLFYGLEFWEHMPAVAAAGFATVWFLRTADRAAPANRSSALVSGLLYGFAILLRPEAAWFFVAAVLASRLLPAPPDAKTLLAMGIGLLGVLMPMVLYAIAHFGALLPPHVTSHSALLTEDWLAARTMILATWFLSPSLDGGRFWGPALVVCLALGLTGATRRDGRLFLSAAGLIDVALVTLSAPNDGGGQWGPRYLLLAFVPAAAIASGWITGVGRRRLAGAAAVAIAASIGVWVQRDSYRELRGAKRTYGRVLDFVRREVPEHGIVVTDAWWLDQVAAAATDRREFLYAASTDAGREIMERLSAAGAPHLTFIGSDEDAAAPRLWLAQACFREEGRQRIPERTLIAIQLRRSCLPSETRREP